MEYKREFRKKPMSEKAMNKEGLKGWELFAKHDGRYSKSATIVYHFRRKNQEKDKELLEAKKEIIELKKDITILNRLLDNYQ